MRPNFIGIHGLLAVAVAVAACGGPGDQARTSASQDLVVTAGGPTTPVPGSSGCPWGLFHDVSPAGALSGGGTVTAITRFNGAQTDVYAVDKNGTVYTAWWNTATPPTTAPSWVAISPPGTAVPGHKVTAITRYPNTIDLYVVGNDGRVYTRWWTDGDNPGWFNAAPWIPISTPGTATTYTSVAAITRSQGAEIDLYVVGNDGKIYTQWWNDQNHTTWFNAGPWIPISTPGTASPRASVTALARQPQIIDLFVVGNDGKIYTQWWNDQSHTTWFNAGPWSPISTPGTAPLNAPVAAVSRRPTEIDLYITGNDGKIYTMWWNDGDNPGWFSAPPWKPISPAQTAWPGSPVGVSSRSAAQIDLFVAGWPYGPQGIYTQWWNDNVPDHDWFNAMPWTNVGGAVGYEQPVTALTVPSSDEIDLFATTGAGTATSARLSTRASYYPHYRVAGLYYSPPGQGSTAFYSTGTTSGTRTESNATSIGGVAVQVQTPNAEFDGNWQFGTKDGTTTELTKTTSNPITMNSTRDAIDHDSDRFYLWTNSQVDVCDLGTASNQSWSVAKAQAPSIVDVTLGELLGHVPPSPAAQQLLGLLTSDEIAAIAALDPWSSSATPVLDPNRFAPATNLLHVEGPLKGESGSVSNGFAVGYDQSTGTIHGTAGSSQAQVIIGGSISIFGLDFGAKAGPVYTYSYENTTENVTGTQQQVQITLTGASPDMDAHVDTYFDAAFGTYAYVPRGVDVTELRLQGSWIAADLTAMIDAYPAVGRISAYVTPDHVPRVVYRGLDFHIHELRLQGGWIHADLSAVVGGGVPAYPAEGDPTPYVTPDGVARIVYLGTDWHIHELRLANGWWEADLSNIILGGGTAPVATGDPSAYVTPDGVARVLYSGQDEHVHELRLQGGWIHADLSTFTTNGAPTTTAPGARTFGYVDPNGVPRVVYGGTDKHVHELRLQGSWLQTDLTAAAGGTPPQIVGDPYAYVTPDHVAKVVYEGNDLDIHELRLTDKWYDADLSGISGNGRAPTAGGMPFALVTGDGVAHVFYRNTTGDIIELRLVGGWYWADLSRITSDGVPAPATSDPTGYVTPDGITRVLYH